MILLSPHLVNYSNSPVQVLACSLNQRSPLLQSVYFSDSHIISTHIEERKGKEKQFRFLLLKSPSLPTSGLHTSSPAKTNLSLNVFGEALSL